MAKITCNFLSYTLHRAVDITVIVPSVCFPEMTQPGVTHKKDAKYPVLYLLHGYGNNHATWNGYTSVELYAEEHNMAVVMLSAENKSYIDHGGDDNYYKFVSHELPEFVKAMFPISEKPEDTYIAGLSMGGFGSLIHGLSQSKRFAAIGAFSGAPAKRSDRGPEFDPYYLAEKCAEEDRRVPVYISCGDKDGIYEGCQKFRDHLLGLGFDVTWVVGEGYQHEWRFWNREVEAFLKWIPRTDPWYTPGKVRKI